MQSFNLVIEYLLFSTKMQRLAAGEYAYSFNLVIEYLLFSTLIEAGDHIGIKVLVSIS